MDASLMRQSALLIPAYQPDDRLPPYVEALKSAGVGKIIVVDDGSGDKFQPLFGSIPQDEITHVISYTPNGGKGHAMREGMRYLITARSSASSSRRTATDSTPFETCCG